MVFHACPPSLIEGCQESNGQPVAEASQKQNLGVEMLVMLAVVALTEGTPVFAIEIAMKSTCYCFIPFV